ncbi:ribonuclease D [Crocosphaera sp. Alani8]|uniref:ribonuclease D n=1 Tax=Crocosphaera sp. Alani8 TaxID=3038952 RepID=UPI00313E8909
MSGSSESSNNFQVCDRDLPPEILKLYSQSDAIAIDTETMGLIPQRDRLCLVQLCDSTGYVTAIRIERGQKEAPNLKQLLENKNIVKIFHYARFDVGQFKYNFAIETTPIFCTKIASKLGRTYTGSHGLKSLVQELEGVELDKSSQSSDWGNSQKLSEAQLSYAANDVRYLIPLREQLITMLQREERWEIAQKCMKVIPVFVELDLMHYKDIFEH